MYWVLFGLVGACLAGSLAGYFATGTGYTIPAGSMQPTLPVGSHIIAERGTDVRRGDIAVMNLQEDSPVAPGIYVKRVIGLPGDHVACCDAAGDITVNGKALHEQQYLYPGNAPSAFRFSVTVAPGEVWVMGDHRAISFDSRGWGRAVPEQQIVGRVAYVSGSSHSFPATPDTYVADGLAPADTRPPWPLVLIGAAALAFLALIVLSVYGAISWGARRGRERRRQAAAAYAANQQVT